MARALRKKEDVAEYVREMIRNAIENGYGDRIEAMSAVDLVDDMTDCSDAGDLYSFDELLGAVLEVRKRRSS